MELEQMTLYVPKNQFCLMERRFVQAQTPNTSSLNWWIFLARLSLLTPVFLCLSSRKYRNRLAKKINWSLGAKISRRSWQKCTVKFSLPPNDLPIDACDDSISQSSLPVIWSRQREISLQTNTHPLYPPLMIALPLWSRFKFILR